MREADGTHDATAPLMATLYSKVKLFGHPIHPMLVAFPITFFTSTLLASVAYAMSGDRDWFRLAYLANLAGVVTGLFAAVPGFLDWVGIPQHLKAKRIGFLHMAINLVVVGLFTLNLGAQAAQLNDMVPSAISGVFISSLGVLLLMLSSYYGGALVYSYHVGVDLTREQELLDHEDTGAFRSQHAVTQH
jgi:uncharacterized membrane protein